MPKYHRIARLMEILTLVRVERGWGAGQLARHFGISRKRIFDDITELNIAGIPIVYGQQGYEILPGFFAPPLKLTPEEVLTALLGIEMVQKGGPISSPTVARMLRSKLVGSLDDRLSAQCRELAAKIASPGQSLPEQVPSALMAKLTRAIEKNRRIQIGYRSLRRTSTSERQVDPYGLVYLKNAWYLTGLCWKAKEIRTFKLLRINEVKPLPLRFQPPKDFSLSRYYEGSWGAYTGRHYTVVARFCPSLARLIREKRFTGATMEAQDDGSLFLTARTRGLKEISWWLMQYGEQVEVLSPKTLRNMIATRAKKMVLLYEKTEPGPPRRPPAES